MRRLSVHDVMTTDVVSVGENAPFKEIVDTLAKRAVSALPVIGEGGQVLGVVSEADLLHKMEFTGPELHMHLLERRRRRTARAKAAGDVARDLMSSPAIVVSPDESLGYAAKLMEAERVKRLPVVDAEGRLAGIVSRSDLLRVYLRGDEAIGEEIVQQVLLRTLWIEPGTVTVQVSRGVVTLSGTVDRRSTVPLVVRLVEGVDGVVDVINDLTYHYDDSAELRRGSRTLAGPRAEVNIP